MARCEPKRRWMLTPRSDRRVDPVAEFLRPDVADKVRRTVGVAVGVAVEAGHAAAGLDAAAVVGGVELLLRQTASPAAAALRAAWD